MTNITYPSSYEQVFASRTNQAPQPVLVPTTTLTDKITDGFRTVARKHFTRKGLAVNAAIASVLIVLSLFSTSLTTPVGSTTPADNTFTVVSN